MIIVSFIRQGKDLEGFRDFRGVYSKTPPPIPLTPAMCHYLLDPETLAAWACRSLPERLYLFEQKWGMSLSLQRLRDFYRQHRIAYRSTQMVYRQAL
jgi:hypothetical protein